MLERDFAARQRGERELRIGSSSMQFGPKREARSETVPFQRDPVVAGDHGNVFSLGVRLKEFKELKGSVPEINKEKAIILAKPSEIDSKCKATGPPTGAIADPSNVLKKQKNQEEWSCTLCRITATSEQALNDHLRGKKHKSREKGLNSQRIGFCTGPLPKTGSANTGKPIKVPGAANEPGSKRQDKKAVGETLLGEVDKSTAQKLPGIDNKISLLQGKVTSVKAENKESVITENEEPQKSPANAKPNQKFKFMCEICQVGAYSLKVMSSHKKGKRHLAKVNGLNKSDQKTSGELCTLKKDVANELIPDTAATGDKSVVEENKNLSIAAVKETIKETPAQKVRHDRSRSNREMKPDPPPFPEANRCDVCKCSFNTFRRRHHCRCCGRILCSEHSSDQMPLPQFGLHTNVRVCSDCYNNYSKFINDSLGSSTQTINSISEAVSTIDINGDLDHMTWSSAQEASVSNAPECKCGMPLCICEVSLPPAPAGPVQTVTTSSASLNSKTKKAHSSSRQRRSTQDGRKGANSRSSSSNPRVDINNNGGWVKIRRCKCDPPKCFDMKISNSRRNPGRPYYQCLCCAEFDWVGEDEFMREDASQLVVQSNECTAADLAELKSSMDNVMKLGSYLVKVAMLMYLVLVICVLLK